MDNLTSNATMSKGHTLSSLLLLSPECDVYDGRVSKSEKKRVNVYLEAEPYDELQELMSEIPGLSFSPLVDKVVKDALPMLKELKKALDAEDPDAMMLVLKDQVMSSMMTFGREMGELEEKRKIEKEKQEKENSSPTHNTRKRAKKPTT
jgi:hypothetical protein